MSETSACDPAFAFADSATPRAARMFANRRRAGTRPMPPGAERRASVRLAEPPAEPAVPPLLGSRAIALGIQMGVSVIIWCGLAKVALTMF
jgi:hypothetical protein